MSLIIPTQAILKSEQIETIRLYARQALPEECCGFLIGAGGAVVGVSELRPARNIAAAHEERFAIDPQAHFDLIREMRGNSKRIAGHYHSHPNGLEQPSSRDLEMAHDPQAIWIIVAASEGKIGRPRAFVCPSVDTGFTEIDIVVGQRGAAT
ncbi:MAG: M67 family metallopeptidase [Rhodospirillaceae bacterium]